MTKHFNLAVTHIQELPVPSPWPTYVPVGAGVGTGLGPEGVELVGQDGLTQQLGSRGSGIKSQSSPMFSYSGHL